MQIDVCYAVLTVDSFSLRLSPEANGTGQGGMRCPDGIWGTAAARSCPRLWRTPGSRTPAQCAEATSDAAHKPIESGRHLQGKLLQSTWLDTFPHASVVYHGSCHKNKPDR